MRIRGSLLRWLAIYCLAVSACYPAASLAREPVAAPLSRQDAETLRKALKERLPQGNTVDEVRATPFPGLYEVRVGTDIFYSDVRGDFVVQGPLIDARERRNLTAERLEKLLALRFDELPLKDAFRIVRGNGSRKLAVFGDPNCGYCKRFEQDLAKVDNVTVHVFLMPILGADSLEKSRNVWCSREPSKAWLDWMVAGKPIAPRSAAAACDDGALARNVAFGKKFRITATPTLVLANGTRVPGAITAADLEKMLVAAR